MAFPTNGPGWLPARVPGVRESPNVGAGGGDSGSSRPLVQTIIDRFPGSALAAIWDTSTSSGSGFTATVTGNTVQLAINATATVTGAVNVISWGAGKNTYWNFKDSYAYVQFTPLQGSGFTTTGADCSLAVLNGVQRVGGAPGPGVGILWNVNNQLELDYFDAFGAETRVGTITYNATNHAWLRLRESGGTIFYEAAPDSGNNIPGTWSVLGSVATKSAWYGSLADAVIQLEAERNSTTTGVTITGPCTFANLNTTDPTQFSPVVTGTEYPADTSTGVADPIAGLSGTPTEYPADTSTSTVGPIVGLASNPTEYPADTSTGTIAPTVALSGTPTEYPADTSTGTITSTVALSGTPTEYPTDTSAGAIGPVVGLSGTPTEYPADTSAGTVGPIVGVSGTPTEYPADAATGTIGPIVGVSGTPTEYSADLSTGTVDPIVGVSGTPTEYPDDTSTGLIDPQTGFALSGAPTEDQDTATGSLEAIVAVSGSAAEGYDTATGSLGGVVAVAGAGTEGYDLCTGLMNTSQPATVAVSGTEGYDLCTGLLDMTQPVAGKSHTDLYIRQLLTDIYEKEWAKKPEPAPRKPKTKIARAVEVAVENDAYLLAKIDSLAKESAKLGTALRVAQPFTIKLPPLPLPLYASEPEDDEEEDLLLLASIL